VHLLLHATIIASRCNTAEVDSTVIEPTPARWSGNGRYGITIPFDGVTLEAHREWLEELPELGYTDVWTGESNAADGFTPLALAAAWAPALNLGTAVVPVYTRGPGLLAMQAATLADLAPGRFALGIGTSSDVIVERWNAAKFEEPYKRVRDTVRFLRRALAGEKVTEKYDTFEVSGFRLGRSPAEPPPIYVAALRSGMLELAGREADGAIINWLSADDVKAVVPHVGSDKAVVARIFVCPSEDTEQVRAVGRLMIAAYLNVEVYAEFHRWLGRGPRLQGMWKAWSSGDRKAALAEIPDEVVDELLVHGSPDHCRRTIQRYVDNGVTVPVLAVVPVGVDLRQAVRDLAPGTGR
jgi:probable F420-dependent oxidoreductase